MHKLFLIFLITNGLQFTLHKKADCDLLSNGTYKLEYTRNSFEESSFIKIENDKFFQYKQNGDTLKGKIEWIYKCSFFLNYDIKQIDTSSLQKMILESFSKSCVELNKKNGDTINFRTTYAGNLEVTINEGR